MFCIPMKRFVERSPAKQRWQESFPPRTKLRLGAIPTRFIASSGYPACDYPEPFRTGVKCPNPGCDGELVEKSSRRGKVFYSCTRYPKCDYATWDWPLAEACPECGHPVLVRKNTKAKGKIIACPKKGCSYSRPDEE